MSLNGSTENKASAVFDNVGDVIAKEKLISYEVSCLNFGIEADILEQKRA